MACVLALCLCATVNHTCACVYVLLSVVPLLMFVSYPSHTCACSFKSPYESGEMRYIVTDPMHIGPSFVLQFDLVMGCDKPYKAGINNQVYLEFSVDHGMTWSLVRAGCWPPRICGEYHTPSVFHAVEYHTWKRVSIALPHVTW